MTEIVPESVEFFHSHCLIYCNSSCPVCFLEKHSHFLSRSFCMECGIKASLWFCLVCGHFGCGYRLKNHAFEHFKKTDHRFVLGLQELNVWDFAESTWYHTDPKRDEKQKTEIVSNSVTTMFGDNCMCAICRYKRVPRLITQLACMKCNNDYQPENLWICVYCSHVGCDKYAEKHALNHFRETNHALVMRLEHLDTWDHKNPKFEYIGVVEAEAIEREDVEVVNEVIKTENYDAPIVGSIDETDLSKSMEIIDVAKEFPTENSLPKEVAFKAAVIIKAVQGHLLARLRYFDQMQQQLVELNSILQANEELISVERLSFAEEKKMLAKKLCEQTKKLNKLKQHNSTSSSPVGNHVTDEIEISQSVQLVRQREFIAIFSMGAFSLFLLRFAFEKVFYIFRNLF